MYRNWNILQHFINVNLGKSIAVNYALLDISPFGSIRISHSTGRSTVNHAEQPIGSSPLTGCRKDVMIRYFSAKDGRDTSPSVIFINYITAT